MKTELNEKEFYKYLGKQDSWKSVGLCIQEFIQLKLKEQNKDKYSEEEVINLLNDFAHHLLFNKNSGLTIIEWFEQFKKK
jgi:hypothetical protein